jgi:competence protein ComEC
MGWGISAIESVAHWTATLPYAVVDLPTMPDWGLLTIAAGGLWLALWRTKWRAWGLAPMAVGAFSLATATPPDLLAAEDGRLVAIRAGGGYLLSSAKSDKIEAEAWLKAAGGLARGAFPEPGKSADGVACDALGCIWHASIGDVAIVSDEAALAEDCRTSALVVALVPIPRACRAFVPAIDHTDLRKGGATAIWLGPPLIVRTANGERGRRPWVVIPQPSISSAGSDRPADPAP